MTTDAARTPTDAELFARGVVSTLAKPVQVAKLVERVPEISVLIDHRTLLEGLHAHGICETDNGMPLPVSTVRHNQQAIARADLRAACHRPGFRRTPSGLDLVKEVFGHGEHDRVNELAHRPARVYVLDHEGQSGVFCL